MVLGLRWDGVGMARLHPSWNAVLGQPAANGEREKYEFAIN